MTLILFILNIRNIHALYGLPDELVKLVVEGKKWATSSYHPAYLYENEELPTNKDVNLITDGAGNPIVIAINTYVIIQPYKEVDEKIAQAEGEGDLSLGYWRSVHQAFFENIAREMGTKFSEDDLVVTEYFKVLKVL
ncbi:hypothetical protein BG261_06970 [Floricoccus tropicus]|uniref:ASCH domain-containing protein n=1 Tax=Floricoccus tropicus TaxID=1859473 RepID=A0A1E8GK57_9LACT|nr:ASCH domain-containing protein [Floricoccus tropicus]OFI48632.1 hypothetical protein BG261_06970 [Floricoccus tropicus]